VAAECLSRALSIAPFGNSVRKSQARGGKKRKGTDKAKDKSLRRLQSQKELIEAKIRRLEGKAPPEPQPQRRLTRGPATMRSIAR